MAAKRFLTLVAILLVFGCGRGRGDFGDTDRVSCTTDEDCPDGTCDGSFCVFGAGDDDGGCTVDNQCASGSCVNGECVSPGGDADLPDEICQSDAGCAAGEFCHYPTDASAVSGLCQPLCDSSIDCYFGQLCYHLDGRCYTQLSCAPGGTDCPPGEYCDPGANPATGVCTFEPVTVIDWCRLERPAFTVAAVTQEFEVAGRVIKAGTTDLTTGFDQDGQLIAAVGFGPLGTQPIADPLSWNWFSALGNADFFDTDQGDIDEYAGMVYAPVVTGDYALAVRFSGDGGARWTYCDLDTGEPGEDGSENGYQADNAGVMTVVPHPCATNPCTSPDPPSCDPDGYTRVVYQSPGDCTPDGAVAICDYPSYETDCSVIGASCSGGACVGGAGPPTVEGQIIVSEIMGQTGPGGDLGEWVELHNTTDEVFNLEGCSLSDDGGDDHTIIGILAAPPQSAILLAKSSDPVANHALPTPDYVHDGFDLGNTSDEVVVTCGGQLIDRVDYQAGFIEAGVAKQLDPTLYDHLSNDIRFNFCAAAGSYGNAGMLGSPGATNPPCPPPDIIIDTCRVQAGLSVSAVEGVDFTAIGRVFNEGLTDLTHGVDDHPNLLAEAGYGPEDSDPSAAAGSWTWFAAGRNTGWDAQQMNDVGFDEYRATYLAPPVGTYHHGFRFSLDSGASWTYCDRDSLDPSYDVVDASRLVTVPNPCAGSPCPAVADCAGDGVTTITAPATTCTIDGVTAVCDYVYANFDCSLLGGTCAVGTCVGSFRTPVAGEVVISEVMHSPAPHLNASDAQWLELRNLTGDDLALHDCVLAGNNGSQTIFGGLVLGNQYAIFAGSLSPGANGGLTADHALGLQLGVSDDVTLTCGATLIDAVSWDDGVTFPGAHGIAMAVSPGSLSAAGNDAGTSWCLSRATAPVGDHFGTPGFDNLACKNQVDRCRLDWPADLIDVEEGTPQPVNGLVEDLGLTDLTAASDGHPALTGQVGFGPDGTDPTDPTWVWVDATVDGAWTAPASPDPDAALDQYVANLPAPAPGTWDVAYRFSNDGGRAWTECDQDEGTYEPANAGHMTTVESTGANLIFTEYVEGSGNNKGVEIYNAGNTATELSTCQLNVYFNGNTTPLSTLDLTAHSLTPDAIRLVCHVGLTTSVTCDQSDNDVAFNGNDAVELVCDGVVQDIIGEIGNNPGTEWGSGLNSTADNTLRRKCTVTIGDRIGSDTFDPAVEWDGFDEDTFANLGVWVCP